MKRLIFDVPRWSLYLHRRARGLDLMATEDSPLLKLEDELFERLYAGEAEWLNEKTRDNQYRGWAEQVHEQLGQLPSFARLAAECQGDASASAIAVERLMSEIKDQLPELVKQESVRELRRLLRSSCERASMEIEELREMTEGFCDVAFGYHPGTGSALGMATPPDGVLRSSTKAQADRDQPYKGFWAEITLAKGSFTIKDNCGGIDRKTAENYAFMMGRPKPDLDADLPTVGMYGIGMKRAIFKMGRSAKVTSPANCGTTASLLACCEPCSHGRWVAAGSGGAR